MLFEITFDPNPVQKQFIEAQNKADLFSSRMGEGKSAGLCWASLYHARLNPGAEHAFVRDTWENLRATTLKEFFYWFPPGVMGTFNESKKEWRWANGIATGSIVWLGLDDPNDAGKLQSRPLAGIFIDEPAPALRSGGIPEEIFDIGFSRLRQKDMKWYVYKLATNNPDETHWTFRRFVSPGEDGLVVHQTIRPENLRNLPADYYQGLRNRWHHRTDFIDRFVDGKYGFMKEGQSVTPEWSDHDHLATGLAPVRGQTLFLLWDFGLNPTCIVTQVTPMREWLVLDAIVGEDCGVEELISEAVKPLLADRYRGFSWKHIGDPQGAQREQTSSERSAIRSIHSELGGTFRRGPKDIPERVEPLRAVLKRRMAGGRAVVQVDRTRASAVWQALRGGWHYHVAKTGVMSVKPLKNIHSHPGDAMGYGAAVLFPMGRLLNRGKILRPVHATFFGEQGSLTFGSQGVTVPPEARVILPRD